MADERKFVTNMKRLLKAEAFAEAEMHMLSFLMNAAHRIHRRLSDGAVDVIRQLSVHSEMACAHLAILLIDGRAKEVRQGEHLALFERAISGDDEVARNLSHFHMGLIALGFFDAGERDVDLAMNHFKAATDWAGSLAMLGLVHEIGDTMGRTTDNRAAVEWYRKGVELNDNMALTRLGLMMLDGRAEGDRETAMAMIARAAEAGYPLAVRWMERLTEGDDDADVELPSPPDGEKPVLIVEAFINELGMPREEANDLTAAIYGYSDWDDLAEDMEASSFDPADEDRPAEFVRRLRAAQAEEVAAILECDPEFAEVVIALLRPTSRDWRPSLAKLGEELARRNLDDRVVRWIPDEDEDDGGDDPAELPEEVFNFMMDNEPISPIPWLTLLEAQLSWKFDRSNPGAARNGSWIANAVLKDGGMVPVYMTSAFHPPFVEPSPVVADIMHDIEAREDRAILIFGHPVFMPVEKGRDLRKTAAVLYGGISLSDGNWRDFVLAAKGGADCAFSPDERDEWGSPAFKKRHALKEAIAMAMTIVFARDLMEYDEDGAPIVAEVGEDAEFLAEKIGEGWFTGRIGSSEG